MGQHQAQKATKTRNILSRMFSNTQLAKLSSHEVTLLVRGCLLDCACASPAVNISHTEAYMFSGEDFKHSSSLLLQTSLASVCLSV